MSVAATSASRRLSDASLGLWLGALGVVVFALTLPMTRLATGTVEAPQLSPWFVTFARAALAGGLSAIYLTATRSRQPTRAERGPLLLSLAGNAIGFPLLLGWAMRHVTASHAAVIGRGMGKPCVVGASDVQIGLRRKLAPLQAGSPRPRQAF